MSGFSLFFLFYFHFNTIMFCDIQFMAETNPCQKVITLLVIHNDFPEIPNISLSLTSLVSMVTMVYYVSVCDGHIPQITQVAATEASGGKAFNVYVKPTIPISETAQQVTGIRMVSTISRSKKMLMPVQYVKH